MNCQNCGAANDADARFCSNCARPTAAPMPSPPTPTPTPPSAPSRAQAGPPDAARAAGLVGSTLDGKYRVEGRIAAGGMGTVYRATRLLIGDEVAIKILHPEHFADASAAERFRREAQAAARLKHPNAVSVYDFGVTNEGLVYLVMELVGGESLRRIIKGQGPLTPSAAADVMRQVCAALDEAHRQSIVHRDVKADNIIIHQTPAGLRVKVLDFGIAKLRDVAASNLTQTGSVMGTPHYMSPEQCVGEELDSRSDIYSLGVVLYEMLAGVVPFNSPTSTAVIIQHVNQPPPPLRSINMSVPEAVERVVMHALQKRREDRPQTAGVLAAEMDAAVGSFVAAPAGLTGPASVVTAVRIPPAPPTAAPVPSHSGEMPTMVITAGPSGGYTPPGGIAPAFGQHSGPSAAYPGYAPPAARRSRAPLFVALALLLLAGAGAGGYFVFARPTPRELVLDEVKKNLLVKPEGTSAYDVYIRHRGELTAEDRREIGRKVSAPLEKRGEEIIARVKQDLIESEADWSEAARAFEWLNELEPRAAHESRKHFALGRLALMQKDLSKAQADFMRSTQLDSSWALPINSLGRVFYQSRDKTRAKEQYRRATALEPDWIFPWINLGSLYYELKDFYNAEEALRRALALDPKKASAHNLLGDTLDKQGRPCDAIAEYRLALETASASTAAPNFDLDGVNRKIQKLSSENFCW
ncbi:MAG TPA: protein kinase [Pyrinomonadaceae bacterium]|nr:protein kinase [Pyrinomonadaceae bacterium]